ncbi:S8 family peptidase [Ferrimonas pelagia]|uniref:S8 family peptidase n=1 Tax=Ferrimonas pelagia TaxID=1177826 RepID=UPI0031EE171E
MNNTIRNTSPLADHCRRGLLALLIFSHSSALFANSAEPFRNLKQQWPVQVETLWHTDPQTIRLSTGSLQVQFNGSVLLKAPAQATPEQVIKWCQCLPAEPIQQLYLGHSFSYFRLTLLQDEGTQALQRLQQQKAITLLQPDLLQLSWQPNSAAERPIGTSAEPPSVNTQIIQPSEPVESNLAEGITIAVIDDGFRLNHAELSELRVAFSFDVTQGNWDPSPKHRRERHGNLVLGLLGAKHDSQAPEGLAPDADYVLIRQPDSWTSNTLISLQLAKLAGADIINNSWHTHHLLEPIADVVADLRQHGRSGKGIPVVFAAGNQAQLLQPNEHEASLTTALVIGASASDGSPMDYSNQGPSIDAWFNDDQSQSLGRGKRTRRFSGTSAAAAKASGWLAQQLSADPTLTVEELEQRLKQSQASVQSIR